MSKWKGSPEYWEFQKREQERYGDVLTVFPMTILDFSARSARDSVA